MKKVLKSILLFIAGAVIAFVVLYGVEMIKERNKLYVFKNDLLFGYYDKDVLRQTFRDHLGEDYIGDLEQDFDHYVINLVLSEISQLEDEKNKVYNSFLSEAFLEIYHKEKEEVTAQLSGESIDQNIYYLQLTTFNDKTYKQINKLVPKMEDYDHIIIDMRDNTG